MKSILSILSIFFFLNVGATDYYFSAAGNNSNAGTSTGAPWLTLSKLTSVTLAAGDHVYLRKGDTFLGGITILQSGSAGNPIIFDAYGSGAKPIITGFATTSSSWTLVSGGIYKVASGSTLTSCNMVLRGGIVQQIGRYPNADAANKGYLTYQSHSGQTSITSNAISSAPSFVGGEVVIRPIQHILDRCVITGQTSTTVSYTSVSSYTPIDNYGFFFQNHINTLDQLGEYWFDPSTKEMNMYWGATTPTAVQVATLTNLIVATSRNYITFQNLAFTGSNADAFLVSSGSNIFLNNCDISYCGGSGIEGANAPNLKVTNSTINWVMDNGIRQNWGVNNATGNDTVTNCTITNVNMIAGMGRSGDVKGMGVAVYGANCYVANNVIRNIGYCPVYFVWGSSTKIRNNVLDSFCITKQDGGGIYTYNNGASPINYTGQKITGNIISNSVGAAEGTPTGTAAYGIYLDINVSGLTIDSNTVFNCDRGIFNHNSFDFIVRNNTCYNNTVRQFDMTINSDAPFLVRNVTSKNNIWFARTATQITQSLRSTGNDVILFGTFDSNYYCRPILETTSISTTVNTSTTTLRTLSGWQTYSSQDAHSNVTSITTTDESRIRFEYNITGLDKNVDLNGNTYVGVDGTVYSGTLTLSPYTSKILIATSIASSCFNHKPRKIS